MCVSILGSLFEAIDRPLETIDLLFFSNGSETLRWIHVDLFLNEIIEKGCLHVHLPYFIVIPCCYGKQYPSGLGHGYRQVGFLKVDPELLSVSFFDEPSFEGSNLPVSSKLMFVNPFSSYRFNAFMWIYEGPNLI
ncbi:UNVERIFIED_CONTAM: hypothetical protein Slati_4406000 [Sesamum latifolium]|uniref:F-box protein n=1 Tax=Sesamum latifolium TaxID=2727402 RepID=A0AAW2SRF8_9LAMI